MKKYLLLFSLLISVAGAYAQTLPDHVKYEPRVYGLKISPNGQWIANYVGHAKLYNTSTGESVEYRNCTFGLGNIISNTGMAVAGTNFLKDGEIILAKTPEGKAGFDMDGITPDGKRVIGWFTTGPFVADVDDNLNLVNVVYLPHPELDPFDSKPQWVSATWISDDGKTIAGQIQDGYGLFIYPIIYRETEAGWEYSLPTASLFNPTGVEIIQNPYDNEPPYPHSEDFMSGANRTLYQQAYQAYLAGLAAFIPDPEDFMSEEEFAQYSEAVETYNYWFENMKPLFDQFIENYYEILSTSPSFSQHELAIKPSGEYVYMNGGAVDENNRKRSALYRLSFDGVEDIIPFVSGSQYPNLVLSDGTVITSVPMSNVPTCYLLDPDTDEFYSLQDLLNPDYPEIVSWLEKSFPGGLGTVSMSDDKSVIVGAVTPMQLSAELYAECDYNTASWIVNLNLSGVESIALDPDENTTFNVYNLQGLKVMETKEKSDLNSLPRGIYIINGKKIVK